VRHTFKAGFQHVPATSTARGASSAEPTAAADRRSIASCVFVCLRVPYCAAPLAGFAAVAAAAAAAASEETVGSGAF